MFVMVCRGETIGTVCRPGNVQDACGQARGQARDGHGGDSIAGRHGEVIEAESLRIGTSGVEIPAQIVSRAGRNGKSSDRE